MIFKIYSGMCRELSDTRKFYMQRLKSTRIGLCPNVCIQKYIFFILILETQSIDLELAFNSRLLLILVMILTKRAINLIPVSKIELL